MPYNWLLSPFISMPEKVQELAEKLHAWQEETNARFPTPNPAVTAET